MVGTAGIREGTVRRYCIFFVGLLVLSMGVAIITKASLGTSPITSIPYSLSMIFTSVSLGNFTILFSLLLVLIQALLLRRRANKVNLVTQVIVSFVFGYFVDFGMWLFDSLDPAEYVSQLVCVVIGCFCLAFGVYMQIITNLTIVPGDGLSYTLTLVSRKPYNRVRVTQDVTLIIIAAIIGLVGLGNLGGVREGTIISALLVGNIAGFFVKHLGWLTERLVPGRNEEVQRIGSGDRSGGTAGRSRWTSGRSASSSCGRSASWATA